MHLAAGIVSSALWTAGARAWAATLERNGLGDDLAARFARQTLLVWAMGVLLYLLSAAGHYLIAAFEEGRRAEARALELQLLAGQAELRALRAQIDPHFLFNSLNSISALAGSDPAAARRMCILLADFLRNSLHLSEKPSIPLEQELALARDYLAIEQVRFGARLAVKIEMDEACRGALVPPLITQPLAENAVRHGIASLLEGGTVRIAARRGGEGLRLVMENPCDAAAPERNGSGVGLSLVRRRLEAHAAHAGRAARLDVARAAGSFRVEIALDAA
jgi:LytS/YehU family sensor histidine kinase